MKVIRLKCAKQQSCENLQKFTSTWADRRGRASLWPTPTVRQTSILKEVLFWTAPPSIGHYREPRQQPLPTSHRFQGIRYRSLKIGTLTD